MSTQQRVLYIEDDPVNRALVRKLLKAADYECIEAETGLMGIQKAQECLPDLILMDMSMPGLDGYEATTRIKAIEELKDTPVIAVTAHAMKGDRERCLTAGCDGYISKPIDIDMFIDQVSEYLKGAQEKVSDQDENAYLREYNKKLVFRLEQQVKELQTANDELELMNNELEKRVEEKARELVFHAYHDPLTGLPNRRLFMDRLEQAAAQAPRTERYLVLMALDLDRFKNVNESLGHDIGDKVLKEIAKRLESCLRTSDSVARVGADEFFFILTNLSVPYDASIVAQRILNTVSQPIQVNEHEIFVTTSIGIAQYVPSENTNTQDLIKNADVALERSRKSGPNSFQFYSEDMNATAKERFAMESSLRRALERNEFLLHYQPQVDLQSGEIVGAEALIRWQRPEKGLIPPFHFIPLLEETGLIVPAGEWILRTACEQNMQWQREGLKPFRVSVNISAHQFRNNDLDKIIERVLNETGLDPKWLELEITESVLMENTDSTIKTLSVIQAMGVNIAMDDFGTGYSSLAYLKRFPLNTLKIDRSFIKDLPGPKHDEAIVSAVITMARHLDMYIVAEGIETEEQADYLRNLECHCMQGYLFSKPLPANELENGILK